MLNYKPYYKSDDQQFSKKDWREEVAADNTNLGFKEWREHQIEAFESDTFDQEQALSEGWCLIDKDCSGMLEIQRNDEGSNFDDDEDAQTFVQAATQSSRYHAKAIRLSNLSKRKLRLRLVLDVEYKLGDEEPETLERALTDLIDAGMARGMITGSGPATVDSWGYKVTTINSDANN